MRLFTQQQLMTCRVWCALVETLQPSFLCVSLLVTYLQLPNNRIILGNTPGQSGAPHVQLALGAEGGSCQPSLQRNHRLAH